MLQFKTVLENIGGKLMELDSIDSLQQKLNDQQAAGDIVINRIAELAAIDENISTLSANELAGVETAYLNGGIAVAENGAVWIYESQMGNRLLPFICQHLVMLIHKENIVATMHHAYLQIDTFKEGFGVFIAGPSKTADIEQSLVIGAHGARSLTIYQL